jgi:hypothetical protein
MHMDTIIIMDNITLFMTHYMMVTITGLYLIIKVVIVLMIQPMDMFITICMDHITKLILIFITTSIITTQAHMITLIITILTTIIIFTIIAATINLLLIIITIITIIMGILLHIMLYVLLMLTAVIIVHTQYQIHIITNHAVQL